MKCTSGLRRKQQLPRPDISVEPAGPSTPWGRRASSWDSCPGRSGESNSFCLKSGKVSFLVGGTVCGFVVSTAVPEINV